jgi:predicted ATPase/class 3 adenylate cyclase
MSTEGELRTQLTAAIEALEGQRAVLGDAVVDLAIAPLRGRLGQAPTASADSALAPQLKAVTILFVDIVGSTAIGERLDAEDVAELLGEALQRFAGAVEAHRGRVFNYTGDGLMAVFGADNASEDDAEQAIRAGLAMIDAIHRTRDAADRFNVNALDVRVGINTGPTLIGGTVEGRDGLHGHAVNVAARMEQSAPIGGLRVSHNTYRLVRGLFDVTEEAPISVKGVADPIRTYIVHCAKPQSFRQVTRGIEGIETEMVGRHAELAQLQTAFRRVHEHGELARITIIGHAGLGKSRLLYELENWAEVQRQPFYIFKGRAQPQTRRQPYGLLRDLLAWRLQIADSDTADIARDRFVTGLAPWFADDGAPVHLLGQLIGLDFTHSSHVRGILADPHQIRTRGFAAAAQVLRRMATTGDSAAPIVMLVEDLHWADDDTLDLFVNLERAHADVPIVIVASTRPELLDRRPDIVASTSRNVVIELTALDSRAAAALATSLLQKMDSVPSALRDAITSASDGNPFFIEEIVKMLLDEGAFVSDDEGVWSIVSGRLDSVRVPATLVGVLQARIDALGASERSALQQAAVIGFLFWDRALAALDGRSPASLAALTTRGFVNEQANSTFADATEYTFQHHLLQQFAYDSVLKVDRQKYHALAASWLSRLANERGPEFLGATGEHHERAGAIDDATDCYVRAAESAAGRDAQSAALDLVDRALTLAGDDANETTWRLIIVRESILALRDDRDSHTADLQRLARIADALDDDSRRALASLRSAEALMNQAEHREGEAAAWRTIALADRAGDPNLAALARAQLSVACRRTNRIAESRAHAEAGLALARSIGDVRAETSLLGALSAAVGDEGDRVGARRLAAEALTLARESGDRVREANMLNNLGHDDFAMADIESARALWDESLRLSREIDWSYGQAIALLNLCGLCNVTGEYHSGLSFGAEAIAITSVSRARDLEATTWLNVGVAHSRCGELAEARAALVRSRDLFDQNDGAHYAMDPVAALGAVLLAEGDLDGAMVEIERVLDFIGSGGDMRNIEDPFRMRLDCFTVLTAARDRRASDVLGDAHAGLVALAAQLPDDGARHRFLDGHPINRALMDAWQAMREPAQRP